MNLRHALEEIAATYGEPIESVVVGQRDDDIWADRPLDREHVVLSSTEGLSLLDEDVSGADGRSFYAWTKSRVFFVAKTGPGEGTGLSINYVPRDPQSCRPGKFGRYPGMDRVDANYRRAAH